MAATGLGYNRYGKGNVRLLRVIRDTARHEIHEMKAQVLLEGEFTEAFTKGLNHEIVPTETQKNTLYVLAKKFPVDPIEEWVQLVAKFFMGRYNHISAVNLDVDLLGWQRIIVGGKEHNHAFQKSLSGTRFVNMRLDKQGNLALTSGFKDLQVLKSTQAGFEGFIKDEFTTLPEANDRVLATKITCQWIYSNKHKNIAFTNVFNEVQKIVIERFAGDPDKGIYSPSVQQTMYDCGMSALAKFPEIEKISFALPNIHYYKVNFGDYKTDLKNNNEVFFTFDGAHGQIEATIERKPQARL